MEHIGRGEYLVPAETFGYPTPMIDKISGRSLHLIPESFRNFRNS